MDFAIFFFYFFASYCLNALDLVLTENRNEKGVKKIINIIKKHEILTKI